MEELYTIKDKYAEIILPKEIYPLVSVKKAISNFMDDLYIKIDDDLNNVIIKIELKQFSESNLNEIIGEFYNELLRESLRYDIAIQTKNIRELIIGRALYATCIDTNENEDIGNEDNESGENYNINEIAVNWFDKYGNKEE